MCEINPTHKKFFRLEVFTSHPAMTEEEFIQLLSIKLLDTEMTLNASGMLRFHIHEED